MSRCRFGLFLLLCLAPAAPSWAQGLILPSPVPIPRPGPRLPVQPISVRSQKVTLALNSGVMKVDVEQVFQNPGPQALEGTYVFPLPEGAAVSSFRLLIDKEPTEGKLLSVDDARKLYESYVRRSVDPALLEYVGRNAFQARVFPIPPGGERRLYLSYSQPLAFQDGVYRAVYPLASERLTGSTIPELTLDCTLTSSQPLKAIYSPTHEIQVKRESDTRARATFEGKDVRANRDFLLYYTTSEKNFGLNALAHRRVGEDGYVLLLLAPKREASSTEVQPKDVVFIFDTSGSMQGAKLEQAQKALSTMLSGLNERDRFTVIRFSSDVTPFESRVVPATKENRERAQAFVRDFKAVGGTAIDDALQAGLAALPSEADRKGHQPYMIFMTDGLPTIGETDVAKILSNAKKGTPKELRLFSFGVGADVNTLLLDRLARENRGDADYVAANEDLESRVSGFYQKIAQPVLSNVQVTLNGATLKDVYPKQIPDLFAGTQLLLLGRYTGAGKTSVTLTGELNGAAQEYRYDLTLPDRELGQEFLPKLWGSRRIGFLLEQIRLNGEDKELKDEVIRLSKEYGIITPYTAYLVEEPNLPPQQPPTRLGLELFGRQETLREGMATAPVLGKPASGSLGGVQNGQGGFGGGSVPGDRAGAAGGAGGRGAGLKAEPGRRMTELERAQGVGGPRGQAGGVGGLAAPRGPVGGAAPAAQPAEQQSFRYFDERKKDLYYQQVDGFKRSTGWNAVESSKQLRSLRDREQAEADVELTQSVAGRTFQIQNGGWVDQTIAGKPKLVPVKYGSDAYFQLVSARKEWARYLSLGRQVAFRTGKTTVVVVDDKGKEKLTPAEIKALAQ